MIVKLKVFKGDDNKDFRPVQKLTLGKADFNRFMQLRDELVIAAENFKWKKIVPSADINIVQRHEWTTETSLKSDWCSQPGEHKEFVQYIFDKLESSYAQVQVFARKKDE